MAKCEAWVIYLLQTSAGYHVCDIISTSVVPTHARGDVTLWLYALIEPTKCISDTLERNAESAMDQTNCNLPEFNLDKYPYLHRLWEYEI